MKTVTIRGIDPELADKLKSAAAEQGKSINQFTLELVRERLGIRKEKRYSREYHDLDHLFGRWNEAEFREIQAKMDQERRIDPELW